MSLIYKTLFEVKLLHEYYCTNADGKTVFDFPLQQDRLNFLFGQFDADKESISTDVEYKFPEELEALYSGYNLKLLPSWHGCKIAVRVNAHTLPDNSLVFEPFTPLPENLNIYILVSKKSALFDNLTNSVLTGSVPAIYLFSNEDITGAKLSPFLTSAVSAFDGAKIYEQGELASFGANDIREFYTDGTGGQFQPVTGSSFANENDRLLLPSKFYYSFNSETPINNAQLTLKDNGGNTVASVAATSADSLQKTLLNFFDKASQLNLADTFLFPDLTYSLEVTGDNGYSKNYPMIFSDALYDKTNWGVIHVKSKVTNSAFNLFASDGFLIRRKNAAGIWTDAPVFEIFIKSRFNYWRYINDTSQELDLIPALADYLFKEDKILLTKKPRSISKSYFLLEKEGTTDTIYVPNPVSYDLKKDTKGRLCFDVIVPQSDLFPVI